MDIHQRDAGRIGGADLTQRLGGVTHGNTAGNWEELFHFLLQIVGKYGVVIADKDGDHT